MGEAGSPPLRRDKFRAGYPSNTFRINSRQPRGCLKPACPVLRSNLRGAPKQLGGGVMRRSNTKWSADEPELSAGKQAGKTSFQNFVAATKNKEFFI